MKILIVGAGLIGKERMWALKREYADNYINIDVIFDVTLVKQANR